MQEHVTLLGPRAPPRDTSRISALPRDLLDQVRGRVRLLSLLLLCTFSVGPVLFVITWSVGMLRGDQPPAEFYARAGFVLADAAVALASAVIWWTARRRDASPSRLLTLVLIYEVVVCFTIAFTTMWEWYVDHGVIPPLTWVPTVIVLFPLIMPGPPRRMLAAAVAAAAMSPLALLLLERWGKVVTVGPDAWFQSVFGPALAVGFAYVGARVVYGLGREVATAREMGSYHLEERLGEGGMGEVWRARHRMLARPAAIKLIRRPLEGGAASEDLQRRFEQEARAIARLRSPHTVELFDYGVAADGAFYFVMELLEGLDADALVRRHGPLPSERAVFVLRQVCHSLSEAESCGLVHRDIKPANIFLCRYGEDHDFVKVLDFGLVKALDGRAATGPALTMENLVQGTPAFIAPEQALGGAGVDGRADIYATGCVAYWLLTGQYVFTGESPMAVVMHHVHTPPVAPSVRSGRPIAPALEQLVLACLAKDPADRPQTARELSRRLGEADRAESWSESRAREWWTAHEPAGAPPRGVPAE
jgi:eukaryotic-like serine/threonine-protein kinase